MGQNKDIAQVLSPIENGKITKAKLDDIDSVISNLENDKAVELILGILDILKIDVDLNAKHILKYIIKLNEFRLTKEDYIQINLDLMMVYVILNNFSGVLIAASAIKIYLSEFNNYSSLRYYFNLTNACYKLKKYVKARWYLNKAKKFATSKYKLNIFSLESNVLIAEKKFDEVISINKKIIVEAKILKSEGYIANSKSNIAYILMKQGKIDEAKKYIESAMTYINNIDDLNKLNVLNNKFYFEIITNSATLSSFKTLILLMLKANDEIRRNENIELFINKNIENSNNLNDFLEIFKFLKANKVSVEANLKLKVIQHIYKSCFNDCEFTKILDKIITY